jgi:hypothetical protein
VSFLWDYRCISASSEHSKIFLFESPADGADRLVKQIGVLTNIQSIVSFFIEQVTQVRYRFILPGAKQSVHIQYLLWMGEVVSDGAVISDINKKIGL